MIHAVLAYLTCPMCRKDLAAGPGQVRCPAGHTYDLARTGYLTLTTGRAAALGGDSADMVKAREAFLTAGHYATLADRLATAVHSYQGTSTGTGLPGRRLATAVHGHQSTIGGYQNNDGDARSENSGEPENSGEHAGGEPVVIDIGAGTGYYLAHLLRLSPGAVGIAVDASRYALRRAARAHPRIGAVGTDVRGPLPIRTAAASLVLDVFAPRNVTEMHRILRSDGQLVIVIPTARHLAEIVGPLGLVTVDERKSERLREKLAGFFVQQDRLTLDLELSLPPDDLLNLVMMGPTAHHRQASDVRVAIEDRWPHGASATASFAVEIHQPFPR
ncbi:putative RNA methyltransferase [Candidatus Protofrankia californiensis]|uniref:putative RNA methyltransferase n=1 Tax=Candidatus Protofrankia californiensis TaxID=1839754 RepID=UPI0010410F5B|nr:methyltransferase domain-containing protein [Candidatus Protofrankia californiensis]